MDKNEEVVFRLGNGRLCFSLFVCSSFVPIFQTNFLKGEKILILFLMKIFLYLGYNVEYFNYFGLDSWNYYLREF